MKQSFYFVLCGLIFPIALWFLYSFNPDIVLIVALAMVLGLYWLLNHIMRDTMAYDRAIEVVPILEEVYIGNISSFCKRIVRDCHIQIVASVYLVVTIVVIVYSIFKTGVNGWITLVLLGLMAYVAICRSYSLIRARAELKSNPTPNKCVEITDGTYKLDYTSYYEVRNGASYQDMMPAQPKYFKEFKVVSIVIAAIAILLGLLYIASGIVMMFTSLPLADRVSGNLFFMCGSMGVYFGVKDFISCIHSESNNSSIDKY